MGLGVENPAADISCYLPGLYREAFVCCCISHCKAIQLIFLQFNALQYAVQCPRCVRQQTLSIFALGSNMATIVVSTIVICLRHACTRDHGRKGHHRGDGKYPLCLVLCPSGEHAPTPASRRETRTEGLGAFGRERNLA